MTQPFTVGAPFTAVSLVSATAFVALFGAAVTAHAGETLLGNSYSAETLPAGGKEISQTLTRRWDKGTGTYTAYDFDTEFEYGWTDRFSTSLYLSGARIKAKNAWPNDDQGEPAPYNNDLNQTRLSSIKTQLKYNFLSPYRDGIGLTGVLEIAYVGWYRKIDLAKTKQISIEPKLILQKNFLNDQLITSYNLGIEFEKRSFPESGNSENEVSITNTVGAAYRFAPGWYAGAEARHHADILNGVKNNNTTFFGPSLHYGTKDWYVTVSYLRQLRGNIPYTGYSVDPSAPTASSRYHLEEDTKNELRIKVAYEF